MSLKGVAQETLSIVEAGAYVSAGGKRVDISSSVAAALAGTVLYAPGELSIAPSKAHRPRVVVTDESTGDAARRIFAEHGSVCALNFASARNPGGGFLRGAKAQEEDLARCSALYATQLRCPGYYQANRALDDLAYTDHIIWSPEVPFFRDRKLNLVDEPYLVSIITAPAPNAGEMLRRNPNDQARIDSTLRRRGALVLAAAAKHAQRHLVLGAWGCGVFRNDPAQVARVFAELIDDGHFDGETITFAILDRSKTGSTLAAFRAHVDFGHGR
jgi:uncharacterized protein (TIGR02452 family)